MISLGLVARLPLDEPLSAPLADAPALIVANLADDCRRRDRGCLERSLRPRASSVSGPQPQERAT